MMAYTHTDFLQFSGPLQSALRDVTGWSYGDYWFPQIRSSTGAIACARRAPPTSTCWPRSRSSRSAALEVSRTLRAPPGAASSGSPCPWPTRHRRRHGAGRDGQARVVLRHGLHLRDPDLHHRHRPGLDLLRRPWPQASWPAPCWLWSWPSSCWSAGREGDAGYHHTSNRYQSVCRARAGV